MTQLALATIAFNKPRLIEEQIRLLWKHLREEFDIYVFDASTVWGERDEIEKVCYGRCEYDELTTSDHDVALTMAAIRLISDETYSHIGFLDHDVFPTRPTTLIDKIEPAGFYGIGQRHAPTGRFYLWPGFCFFSREWLAGRPLDFSGIRGESKREDGDTGSGLWPLFEGEDWSNLYRAEHGYRAIREPDDRGLQSWGYEVLGDWVHLSNGSGWMDVPDFEERERLLMEMVAAL